MLLSVFTCFPFCSFIFINLWFFFFDKIFCFILYNAGWIHKHFNLQHYLYSLFIISSQTNANTWDILFLHTCYLSIRSPVRRLGQTSGFDSVSSRVPSIWPDSNNNIPWNEHGSMCNEIECNYLSKQAKIRIRNYLPFQCYDILRSHIIEVATRRRRRVVITFVRKSGSTY